MKSQGQWNSELGMRKIKARAGRRRTEAGEIEEGLLEHSASTKNNEI
jgi:hypothetical protein